VVRACGRFTRACLRLPGLRAVRICSCVTRAHCAHFKQSTTMCTHVSSRGEWFFIDCLLTSCASCHPCSCTAAAGMQGGGASSSADSFWSSKPGVSESDCHSRSGSQPCLPAQLPCHPAPIAGANSTAAHSSTVSTLAAWRVVTCFEYAHRAAVLTLYSATWPEERISATVERQHFLGLLL
jgi:hypothetical protein